jgi:hypothetical protein
MLLDMAAGRHGRWSTWPLVDMAEGAHNSLPLDMGANSRRFPEGAQNSPH